MDVIEKNVRMIVPDLEVDKVKSVLRMLQELGATDIADLPLVKEEDFNGIIKPIQARKLINAWQNTGKNFHFNL